MTGCKEFKFGCPELRSQVWQTTQILVPQKPPTAQRENKRQLFLWFDGQTRLCIGCDKWRVICSLFCQIGPEGRQQPRKAPMIIDRIARVILENPIKPLQILLNGFRGTAFDPTLVVDSCPIGAQPPSCLVVGILPNRCLSASGTSSKPAPAQRWPRAWTRSTSCCTARW